MTDDTIKIAVASESGGGLEDRVGQHFGRCRVYTLVDVQGGEIQGATVDDNPFVHGHAPGDVPGYIGTTGASVVLVGGIGHRAIQFFDRMGIQVSAGHQGTVAEAVGAWLGGTAGGAAPCKDPSDAHHHHDEDHERRHGDCGRHG